MLLVSVLFKLTVGSTHRKDKEEKENKDIVTRAEAHSEDVEHVTVVEGVREHEPYQTCT